MEFRANPKKVLLPQVTVLQDLRVRNRQLRNPREVLVPFWTRLSHSIPPPSDTRAENVAKLRQHSQ
jgi:hypothetical protein